MRNTQLIRWIRIICRLMDGKSRRLEDFEDIRGNLHVKTLRRDLEGLANVAELQIAHVRYQGESMWRMEAQLVADPLSVKKKKVCTKCGPPAQPIECFNKERGKPDGRRNTCQTCTRRATREWQQKNRKHINAYRRKIYKRDHEKINALKRVKHARRKNRRVSAKPVLPTRDTATLHSNVSRRR